MKLWLLLLFSSCYLGTASLANGATDEACALPVAICQAYMAVLDASGNTTITPANVDGGSTYECGLQNMSVTPNAFSCGDVGLNEVTLTVTDLNGNTSACTAIVTVVDMTPPAAICQDITLSLDENGEAAFSLIDFVFYDYSCDRASLQFSDVSQSFTATSSGYITQIGAGIGSWGFSESYGTVISSSSNTVDYGILSYSGRCCYEECEPGNNMAFVDLPVSFYVNAGETVTISFTGSTGDLHYEDNQLRMLVNGLIADVSVDGGSTDACGIASLTVNPSSFDCDDIGENVVTLTVTDVNGNSAMCTATVTIEDVTPPVAVCQDITLSLDENGEAAFPVNQLTFYDYSCDRTSFAFSDVSQSFTAASSGYITQIGAGIGHWGSSHSYGTVISSNSNTVDYGSLTYSGRCCYSECVSGNNMAFVNLPVAFYVNEGETVTISFTGSGGDLHYEDNQLRLLVTGEIGDASDLDGGSTDACGIGSFTVVPNEFSCEDVGPNAVIVTVTDVNGNTSTCNATVTIEDNTAPEALCQSITVQLDGSGDASISADQIDNGSSDVCGIDSRNVTPNAFDCSNVGANTVTLTVTDVNGNSSMCTATVTVEDNVDPVPLCQDVTVQLNEDGTVVVTGDQVDNGSSDACGIDSRNVSPNTFDCDDVGANMVTLTVTDENGNTSVCTATVTVEDNVAPNAICQNITIALDANGEASITAAQVDNNSSDACGIVSSSVSPNSFTCDHVGENTVTLTVTDANGNSDMCTATVTVEDNTPPVAVCQDVTLSLDENGEATFAVTEIVFYDYSCDRTSFAFSNVSQSFTATTSGYITQIGAGIGNWGSAHSYGTVISSNSNTVDYGSLSYSGRCCYSMCTSGNNMAFVDLPVAFYVNEGETVTISFSGSGGDLHYQDNQLRLLVSGELPAVGVLDGGSTDACGIGALSADQTTFGCDDVGENMVTLTVTDVNGNSAMCTAIVTVEDITPPVAVCQDVTLSLDENGEAGFSPTEIVFYDYSCDRTSFAFSNVSQSFTATTSGYITQIGAGIGSWGFARSYGTVISTPSNTVDYGSLTYSGRCCYSLCASGNNMAFVNLPVPFYVNEGETVTISFSGSGGDLHYQDNQLRLLVTGEIINAVELDGGSTDACGISLITVDPSEFSCEDVGPNAVIVTVTDVNGNSSTCNAIVTVEDNTAPEALCQSITVQLDGSGDASITADQIDNGSSDVCGVDSRNVSPNTFDCSNVGANTVTLTVTDVNGNSSECTATVTVEDNVDPVAICQDVTIQLNENGDGVVTVEQIDNGSSDACGIASRNVSPNTFDCNDVGANTVTLTVTDENGNTAACTATVTVEDNVAPEAICQNITIELNADGDASINADQVNNNSGDACGIASTSVNPNTFTCDNVGENIVTLTVTDVNGNSDMCTATVTVEDNTPPVAICQDITVQLDENGDGTITGEQIDNGSSDACGIASRNASPNAFDCEDVGANTVTLTVTDENGNSSMCTATVTVEDNVAPEAICQNITVQLDENGDVSINAEQVDNNSSDACGIASRSVTPNSFTCDNVGENTVTLTVTDENGNSNMCTATVTVEDVTPPVAVCQDVTLSLDENGAAVFSVTEVVFYDYSCDRTTLGFSNVSQSFTASTSGYITQIGAGIGFWGSAHSYGTVISTSSNTVDYGSLTYSGRCCYSPCASGNNMAFVDLPVSFYVNAGEIVTISFSGSGGDLHYQDNQLRLLVTGEIPGVGALDGGSTDACGIASLSASPNSFTCDDLGENNVILTVTDVNGNEATCEAIVTIEDNINPTISCPGDISQPYDPGTCTQIAVPDPVTDDNCAVTELTWVMSGATEGSSPSSGINNIGTAQFNFGVTNITYTVKDASGNSSTCAFSITVTPGETSTIISLSETEQQYSDAITFIVTISGGASGIDCDPKWEAAQSATFYVGAQEMGSADFEVVGTDLVATLADICLLEGLTGQMSPGTKSVSAVLSGIDDVHFIVSQPDPVDLVITQEDASLAYNGQEYFSTPSPSNCTGTVTMSAYVEDVNDTPVDCRGDIRNATITFSNGGIPGITLGTPNLPVGLVNPGNFQEGIAVNVFEHTLQGSGCSSGGETFEVWLKADNYYTGQTTQDEVTLVTLALPGNDFVTGGGHLVLSNSAGTYAGTAGSKMNFGFNMKTNPSGNNLQGAINIIFRKLVNGEWHTYQIKSNKINSMVVNESDPNYRKAYISTKANLRDITDPLNPISLGGNLNLALNAWESTTEENGSLDKIGVTLTGGGGLLFSSFWQGTGTVEQFIDGGKIQVRASGQNQFAAPDITVTDILSNNDHVSVNNANPVEETVNNYVVQNYPNPFNNETLIKFELAKDENLMLKVFNQVGQLVSVLHEGLLNKGMHTFTFHAGDNPEGMYIYMLSSGSKVTSGKMMLVR